MSAQNAAAAASLPDPSARLPNVDEERLLLFLSYLATTGTLASACRHAGLSYAQVRKHMDENEDFRLSVQFHIQLADDEIALEARRRALEGWDEPVIHNGRNVYQPRRNPEGQELRRAVVDPHTGEPVLNPDDRTQPLTEPVLELVTIRKRSDKLLERLLQADPRFSPSTRHRHDHRHQVNAKVGVMVIPAASPEEWSAALSNHVLPPSASALLPDGSGRNAHVIDNADVDTEEEDVFGGLCFDFLEG